MKQKNILTVILVLLAGLFQAGASPGDVQRLAAANNMFAFKLLKQLEREQPATNIFISPYSASTVLQMVGNGAAGQTKTEMQQVLGTTGLSDAVVDQANKDMAQWLNGNTNVILTTADAIWYRAGEPVKPEFIACNQEFFGATVAPLNFDDPHSVDVINAWADEKTYGKISHIADGMIDPSLTMLVLVNAVYFKGQWEDPFDANDTGDRPFYPGGGGQKIVSMMAKSKTFTYLRGDGYQAVRLPYANEYPASQIIHFTNSNPEQVWIQSADKTARIHEQVNNLAMYIFLPDKNSSPEKLLSTMNGHAWQKTIMPGFSEEDGTLVLPKFKIEYSVKLNQPLQELGMISAFEFHIADFSGMAPELYVAHVLQKSFVEVNEEGTEAAAVTAAMMERGMANASTNPFQMIVDRPFLFLIEDDQTGTILFMGIIFDPATD